MLQTRNHTKASSTDGTLIQHYVSAIDFRNTEVNQTQFLPSKTLETLREREINNDLV